MKLTSEDRAVMIFRNDREYNGKTFATYSISVSSKDKDGEWVSGYLPCKFKNGVDIENKTKILIHNAFPTVRKGKDDKTYTEWMITDFEIEGMQTTPDIAEELPWD